MRPDESVFQLRNVCLDRGGQRILTDVDVSLPKSGITALIGPSGSGKTSLLRLLNRLDDPTSGHVEFSGAPIAALSVRTLRRRVGFVFQTPTLFKGTVADNLSIALRLIDADRPVDAARLAEALRLVHLPEQFAERDAGPLSGGEKQRVALARALMTQPQVLLLDEPTASLDPETADQLIDMLCLLPEKLGLTVILVTHRLSEARQASSYAVMLEAGRVVEAGATEKLWRAADSARTRAFIASAEPRPHGA